MYPAGNLVKISPTGLAAAHDVDDVIFTKQELVSAVPSSGGCSILESVTMFIEGAAATDDLLLLFFDNDTALGEPAGDPSADITADEFRAAGCIGAIRLDGGDNSTAVANGRIYFMGQTLSSGNPLFVKADDRSIWVACVQYQGTLDLTDTDSITCTFGFKYLG
jgi:hypothetical protein